MADAPPQVPVDGYDQTRAFAARAQEVGRHPGLRGAEVVGQVLINRMLPGAKLLCFASHPSEARRQYQSPPYSVLPRCRLQLSASIGHSVAVRVRYLEKEKPVYSTAVLIA